MDAAGAHRAPDAGLAADRALEGVGPVRHLRRPADEANSRRQPRDGAGPDARGGDHRPRPRPGPFVQATADDPVPDPDQVPRRAPAPVRDLADPRIPDEGRLQLRRRRRSARRQLRRDVSRPTAGSSTVAASPTSWSKPRAARSAATARTSSWSPRRPARTWSSSAPGATMPPTASGPRSAQAPARPRPTRRLRRFEKVATPNRRTIQEVCDFLKVDEKATAKLLVFLADGRPVAALIRGDHEANEAKIRRAFGATTLAPADAAGDRACHRGADGLPRPGRTSRSRWSSTRRSPRCPTSSLGATRPTSTSKGSSPAATSRSTACSTSANAVADDPCPRCGEADGRAPGDRDRPRLQARHQVFEGDGCDLPRRQGERDRLDHGLLRHRREPDRRGGGRGRARQQRDRLAASDWRRTRS